MLTADGVSVEYFADRATFREAAPRSGASKSRWFEANHPPLTEALRHRLKRNWLLLLRGDFKAEDAENDEPNAHQSDRRGRVSEKGDAAEHRADRSNSSPNGIRGANRQ